MDRDRHHSFRVMGAACALMLLAAAAAHPLPPEKDASFQKGLGLFRAERYEEALGPFRESLKAAEAEGDRKEIIRRLVFVAGCESKLKRAGEALAFYGRARSLAEELGDRKLAGDILSMQAGVLSGAGRYEEAVAHMEKAREAALAAGDEAAARSRLQSLSLYLQIHSHECVKAGEFDKASAALARSREAELALGNPEGAAERTESIAYMHAQKAMGVTPEEIHKSVYDEKLRLSRRADYLSAADLYKKAAAEWKALSKPDREAACRSHAAGYYEMIEERKEALKEHLAALECRKRAGDAAALAEAERAAGMGHCALGEYPRALELLAAASERARGTGDAARWYACLRDLAYVEKIAGNNAGAAKHYEELEALAPKASAEGDLPLLRLYLGECLGALGQFDRAEAAHLRGLALVEKTGQPDELLRHYKSLIGVYVAAEKLDSALALAGRAEGLVAAAGDPGERANLHLQLAVIHLTLCRFDVSLGHYEKALSYARSVKNPGMEMAVMAGIGDLYFQWGKYEEAREAYRRCGDFAAVFREERFRIPIESMLLKSQGLCALVLGDLDGAEVYAKKLSALGRAHQGLVNPFVVLDLEALVLMHRKNFGEALNRYRAMLPMVHPSHRALRVSVTVNIAAAMVSMDDLDGAMKCLKGALDDSKGLDSPVTEGRLRQLAGSIALMKKDFRGAEEHLLKSVEIKERLRLTARGDVRRDYLASQISAYQTLIASYVREGKYRRALDVMELSSAKYLSELLASREGSAVPDHGAFIASLPGDTAVVSYANSGSPWGLDIVVTTPRGSDGVEVAQAAIVGELMKASGRDVSAEARAIRGFRESFSGTRGRGAGTDGAGAPASAPYLGDFDELRPGCSDGIESLIKRYRALLKEGDLSAADRAERDRISRGLYRMLIAPVEGKLAGSRELVIVPDGALAVLPFETLMGPGGKYLAEKFSLRYVGSLGVASVMSRRAYPVTRKPLVAFGGALYGGGAAGARGAPRTGAEYRAFKVKVHGELDRKDSLKGAYDALGVTPWEELPGTAKEVDTLGRLFPGARLYTGPDASEATVRELSKKGELKEYRVVHFATHGIAVPEIPELSALVLSQRGAAGADDGYLTMREISSLSLNADLVVLSACQTGLGRIYSGEGVVGLSQAFMLAGANGLIMSLWNVDDQATMELMAGTYSLVKEKKIPFRSALAEMKRRFISGEAGGGAWKNPAFWAAFIYVGN